MNNLCGHYITIHSEIQSDRERERESEEKRRADNRSKKKKNISWNENKQQRIVNYGRDITVTVATLKSPSKADRARLESVPSSGNSSRQGSVDGAIQKCGLCSVLSRLVRRAMCVGSRRGSGESYYQELADTTVSISKVSMHITKNGETIRTNKLTSWRCSGFVAIHYWRCQCNLSIYINI